MKVSWRNLVGKEADQVIITLDYDQGGFCLPPEGQKREDIRETIDFKLKQMFEELNSLLKCGVKQ